MTLRDTPCRNKWVAPHHESLFPLRLAVNGKHASRGLEAIAGLPLQQSPTAVLSPVALKFLMVAMAILLASDLTRPSPASQPAVHHTSLLAMDGTNASCQPASGRPSLRKFSSIVS